MSSFELLPENASAKDTNHFDYSKRSRISFEIPEDETDISYEFANQYYDVYLSNIKAGDTLHLVIPPPDNFIMDSLISIYCINPNEDTPMDSTTVFSFEAPPDTTYGESVYVNGVTDGSSVSFHGPKTPGEFIGFTMKADPVYGVLVNVIPFSDLDSILPAEPQEFVAGTGISIVESPTDTFTITNDAPDQTRTIAAGPGIAVSGSDPSFTVSSSLEKCQLKYWAGSLSATRQSVPMAVSGDYLLLQSGWSPSPTFSSTSANLIQSASGTLQYNGASPKTFKISMNCAFDETSAVTPYHERIKLQISSVTQCAVIVAFDSTAVNGHHTLNIIDYQATLTSGDTISILIGGTEANLSPEILFCSLAVSE